MKKVILAQFIVLLCGTVFAWFNFAEELINWTGSNSCTIGCTAGTASPFLTPCFGGAIFFTIAFILSVIILKKSR